MAGTSWAKRGTALRKEFWAALETDRRVWCLTTNRGLMPWEDSWGRVTLPLWGTEDAATAAATAARLEEDFEPGDEEVPSQILLADLPGKLVSWSANEVEVVFLNPLERRAPLTLTLAEFAAELDRRFDLQLPTDTQEAFDELARPGRRPKLP